MILCKLADYYRFITDDDGQLRRYLLESNVRDYLGHVPVNQDIAQTLSKDFDAKACDFWWLNNGVTLIATAANVAGKEINIENVQIVNGLQTTETIYEHFRSDANDERAVLVKIIVTSDAEIRDRIIKATNYQTAVELSFLRARTRYSVILKIFCLSTIGFMIGSFNAAKARVKFLRVDAQYNQIFNPKLDIRL